MRPEQEDAVSKAVAYFKSADEDPGNHIPKFLWNAKMRFGKTFAAYELAKRMGFKKILILTFIWALLNIQAEELDCLAQSSQSDFTRNRWQCRHNFLY